MVSKFSRLVLKEKMMEKEELLVKIDQPKEVPAGRIVTARHLRNRTGFGLNQGGKAGKTVGNARMVTGTGCVGWIGSKEWNSPRSWDPPPPPPSIASIHGNRAECHPMPSLLFACIQGWLKNWGWFVFYALPHATSYKAGTSESKRTQRLGFIPPMYAIVCGRAT
ncbi:hypothetical protein PpBr36_01845 [Pyricularia pennisetigena]|uniref:hypothetical protein n=1 Tax=Pyricularia pennisetigena TaxID=1578925 RepID=UPI0011544A3F|nr:hypothetical protein PpBr36_01845 [Pyricularia pennisetigena]TLS28801.1 hypothetical protein PpBr36_01845 [Pyricularia pennisetigena]